MKPRRIAIVGNAGAGKTTLSRQLGKQLKLPVYHVDSIQFLPGMKIRPHAESITMLKEIEAKEEWIIDGYGPFDLIHHRFAIADQIIFLDPPLWRLYFWAAKRQIQNIWSKRAELPEGCDEVSLKQTRKLFQTIKMMHEKMRPELVKIFARNDLKQKLVHVQKWNELKKINDYFDVKLSKS